MTTLRLFIALPLPSSVRDRVHECQRALAGRLAGHSLKWASPDQWHLTLKFLGDQDEAELSSLEEALRISCSRVACLHLSVGDLGVFPHLKRPSVLWLGIEGDLNQLSILHQRVESGMEPWSPREVRPFSPHLTLARVKEPNRHISDLLSTLLAEPDHPRLGNWTADELVLFQSELRPDGAKHTPLCRVNLKN